MELFFEISVGLGLMVLFLSKKLSYRIMLQFFVCTVIILKIGLSIGAVAGFSLFIMEILYFCTLWPGKKTSLITNKETFSASAYSRKALAIITMIVGSTFALIIHKTMPEETAHIRIESSDTTAIILFIFLSLLFLSEKLGTEK